MKPTLELEDIRRHGANGAVVLAIIRAYPEATTKQWGEMLWLTQARIRTWIEYFENEGVLKRKLAQGPKRGKGRVKIKGVEFL